MRLLKAFSALMVLLIFVQQAPLPYGPQGAEGEFNREQLWLVPTPAADRSARAVLFRPPGDGPFHLAVIAHATTQTFSIITGTRFRCGMLIRKIAPITEPTADAPIKKPR